MHTGIVREERRYERSTISNHKDGENLPHNCTIVMTGKLLFSEREAGLLGNLGADARRKISPSRQDFQDGGQNSLTRVDAARVFSRAGRRFHGTKCFVETRSQEEM